MSSAQTTVTVVVKGVEPATSTVATTSEVISDYSFWDALATFFQTLFGL